MARVHVERHFPDAQPDALWDRIGDFHAIADWHPGILSQTSEGGENVRELDLGEAGTVVETLVAQDERTYTYRIDSSPLPVRDYTATISARPGDGGGTVVDWDADFEAEGASDAEADAVIAGIFDGGLAAL